MKPTLKPGLKHRFSYTVPENKTVPYTYPEAAEIAVDAEGVRHRLHDRADGVGMHAAFDAASRSWRGQSWRARRCEPPRGYAARDDGDGRRECVAVTGQRVTFNVKAHDGIDLIGEGRHERFVVMWDKFNARVAAKAAKAGEWRMASGE